MPTQAKNKLIAAATTRSAAAAVEILCDTLGLPVEARSWDRWPSQTLWESLDNYGRTGAITSFLQAQLLHGLST